jgi:hypothetical protein
MGDEDMKDLLHKKLMDVFDKEYPPHKYVPRNDNDLPFGKFWKNR